MPSTATTVEEFLSELPAERREVVEHVRELVLGALPDGLIETMNFGMITYEVPLARYPNTYNKQPLMYAALTANKSHYSLYLHGAYASEVVMKRLRDAYAAAEMKLDMGKSCLRFKKVDQLAVDAVTEAIAAVSVDDFIELYEASRTG